LARMGDIGFMWRVRKSPGTGWSMNNPLVTTATLVTQDGVPVDTVHLPGPRHLAIVMAHGFTQSWQRPMVWKIAKRFNQTAGVVTFDFRGHGRSGGLSTLGDKEINDLDVAVRYARQLGYERVATVGFSMGGSVVLRQGGLLGGVDAVVSVSGPGHWFYRGTDAMRRVHFAAEHRIGRLFTKYVLKTRISPYGWDSEPVQPAVAIAQISPAPVLIVHGDKERRRPRAQGTMAPAWLRARRAGGRRQAHRPHRRLGDRSGEQAERPARSRGRRLAHHHHQRHQLAGTGFPSV
jgi:pimeloyl-ACP methyl ester carboxylesterase